MQTGFIDQGVCIQGNYVHMDCRQSYVARDLQIMAYRVMWTRTYKGDI